MPEVRMVTREHISKSIKLHIDNLQQFLFVYFANNKGEVQH